MLNQYEIKIVLISAQETDYKPSNLCTCIVYTGHIAFLETHILTHWRKVHELLLSREQVESLNKSRFSFLAATTL
jgi:hypothetical protein